ncbi:MAG: hypothetical protein Ct9H300mP1_04640 [Planctomycetaceae bacterium]|nr:MAG: hypothetical protein Ct9H300mP1_04640 [Planctomycetaceae bacterium]
MAKAAGNAMLVSCLLVLGGGCEADPVDPGGCGPVDEAFRDRSRVGGGRCGRIAAQPGGATTVGGDRIASGSGVDRRDQGFEEAVVASLEEDPIGAENGVKLAGLETLEQVRLWNCPDVDDSLVGRLAKLPKLRVLAVRGGKLTDGCFESLARVGTLESLNVGDTPGLTGQGLDRLLTSGRFKRLYLDRTGVTDKVVTGWPVENVLEMLNVNHTGLGPPAAGSLSKFETLRSAFVVGTKIPPEAVAKWRTTRPSCLVYDGRERPGGADSKATRPRPGSR